MLEVRDLHAAYGDAQVLFGASLSVKEGEIVALLGSNGAGKTTLIRCITGLLRTRRGTIEFAGARIDGLTAHEVVDRGIACVPESRQMFPTMSVEEHLLLGSYLRRARSRRARSEEHTSELQSRENLVCRLLLEKKKVSSAVGSPR